MNTAPRFSRQALRSGQPVRFRLPERMECHRWCPPCVLDGVVVDDSRCETVRVEVSGGPRDGETHAVPRTWVSPIAL